MKQILFLILLIQERPLYRVSSLDSLGLKIELFLPLPFITILTVARFFLTHSLPFKVYPVSHEVHTLKLVQVAQPFSHLTTPPEGLPVDAVGMQ